MVLYGLGVTIGAGIYVLIGPAALRAGMTAPTAFVIAALVMGLTATSFAELGTRLPVAAGEAAYIAAGFRSDRIGLLAGLLVIAIAVISAAAVSLGSTGYIRVFLPVPEPLVLTVVVVAMDMPTLTVQFQRKTPSKYNQEQSDSGLGHDLKFSRNMESPGKHDRSNQQQRQRVTSPPPQSDSAGRQKRWPLSKNGRDRCEMVCIQSVPQSQHKTNPEQRQQIGIRHRASKNPIVG